MNLFDENSHSIDSVEERDRKELTAFFEKRKEEVFYSRQVEVL